MVFYFTLLFVKKCKKLLNKINIYDLIILNNSKEYMFIGSKKYYRIEGSIFEMNEVVAGINEESLSSLSLEVLDYSDRISEIFDKLDSCMEKLPDYYQGEACTSIINLYNNLRVNYSFVKSNIISYSDDLMALIRKMKESDKYLANLFREYTDDARNKLKSIKG